jgi:imidazolonepropionase-like amidohydrolase
MKTILSVAFYLLLSSMALAQKTPVLFQKVRVFDGVKVIPETDVLIEGGKIKEMGPGLAADHAIVVDGEAKPCCPG